MESTRAAQALAEASSAMTRRHDVAGALAALLEHCQEGLGVDAGAILVQSSGRLELLASSSHEAAELETHQLHSHEGPCIDAYTTGASVRAHSKAELVARWPAFAETMLAAGFTAVHASPLVMHGSTFGAMGLFRTSDKAFTPEEDIVAQAFADIATMLMLYLGEVSADEMSSRLSDALSARIVLEQAKGVLADAHDLTMAEAYALLVQSARDRKMPLTAWAEHVVSSAQRMMDS